VLLRREDVFFCILAPLILSEASNVLQTCDLVSTLRFVVCLLT
jgi:hypothetical protein